MSNNNSTPPFKVGQRVIALKSVGVFLKNKEYTVTNNYYCERCNLWHTEVAVKFGGAGVFSCSDCRQIIDNVIGCYAGMRSRQFAPIQEAYADITKEILEKFPLTEGGQVDKVLIPEILNN